MTEVTTENAAKEVLETDFSFRTNTDTGVKRPTLTLKYDAPNAVGIIGLLDNPESKEAKLIVGSVQGVLTSYIRGMVDADSEFSQDKLDSLVLEGKISLEAIANLPKSERNVLSKEDLEAFAKDYIRIMPGVTGKAEAKVQAAAGLFVERFKRVAGDNDILKILQDQLATFVTAPEAGEVLEKHEKALSFLSNKLEELLSVKVTADAL